MVITLLMFTAKYIVLIYLLKGEKVIGKTIAMRLEAKIRLNGDSRTPNICLVPEVLGEE
jgi:hypothetical protein